MHGWAGIFHHWQSPPLSMSEGHAAPNADGYGVNWEYNLGTKEDPTRFGYDEILGRCAAIGYANGIQPLIDHVPHQRAGMRNGVSNYKTLSGYPGRFPKTPGCFMSVNNPQGPFVNGVDNLGRVPRDPIAGWVGDDFAFGDELCPINSVPKGYVLNGLIDSGDWIYRRIDAAGCRYDDTKGAAFEAVRKWSDAKAMKGKVVIGEFAAGDHDTLAWWVRELGFRCYTYDFEVKYRARDFCNNGSRYNMAQLSRSGLASLGWPYSMCAVTFIENADSDTNGFGSVIFNKLLGYAWILTSEGWPSVYYRDYAEDKYCYGLKPHIDNLSWIHNHLANGPTWYRHAEYQFVVYERQGWPGLLVGLNNDIWGGWKKVTVQTSFGPHVLLHDYAGHAENDVWTDGNGNATIWIPPNDNGAGYSCWSREGLGKPTVFHPHSTVQRFEGADDLVHNQVAAPKATTPVQRIWCAAHTRITLTETTGAEPLAFSVTGPDGTTLQTVPVDRPATGRIGFQTSERGWHSIAVTNFSEVARVPYIVDAEYTAPAVLTAGDF